MSKASEARVPRCIRCIIIPALLGAALLVPALKLVNGVVSGSSQIKAEDPWLSPKNVISIAALIGAVIAFCVAYQRWVRDQDWKQLEFSLKQVDNLHSMKAAKPATRWLEGLTAKVRVGTRSRAAALWGPTSTSEEIGPEDAAKALWGEVGANPEARLAFDAFLFALHEMRVAIAGRVLTEERLQPLIRYWCRRLAHDQENENLRLALEFYLNSYFPHVLELAVVFGARDLYQWPGKAASTPPPPGLHATLCPWSRSRRDDRRRPGIMAVCAYCCDAFNDWAPETDAAEAQRHFLIRGWSFSHEECSSDGGHSWRVTVPKCPRCRAANTSICDDELNTSAQARHREAHGRATAARTGFLEDLQTSGLALVIGFGAAVVWNFTGWEPYLGAAAFWTAPHRFMSHVAWTSAVALLSAFALLELRQWVQEYKSARLDSIPARSDV